MVCLNPQPLTRTSPLPHSHPRVVPVPCLRLSKESFPHRRGSFRTSREHPPPPSAPLSPPSNGEVVAVLERLQDPLVEAEEFPAFHRGCLVHPYPLLETHELGVGEKSAHVIEFSLPSLRSPVYLEVGPSLSRLPPHSDTGTRGGRTCRPPISRTPTLVDRVGVPRYFFSCLGPRVGERGVTPGREKTLPVGPSPYPVGDLGVETPKGTL